MSDNVVLVYVHVLNGQSIYDRTEGHVLCEECLNHYNSYGHDENGYWKVPKSEDFSNLRSVCGSCVNQILEDRHLSRK